ncbi:MAG: dTMP kinase [Streptococcaceae bacterium]|jgi:dTMP kinase|nr:dTMP kinase [Streptococcaceae bacterium]
MSGYFITIEGPDGAGKTSVLEMVLPKLSGITSKEILTTREPGGIRIAEQIRGVILDRGNTEMDARTEALLFAASRRQHLVEKVIPALVADKIVIADRFIDSSLAYQGEGRKLGMDNIEQLNEFATEGILPDLTIYLDVDSETGLKRIHNNRADEINRLDLDEMTFHQRVRHGYLKLAEAHPERILKIDAKQPLGHVVQEVFQALKYNIEEWEREA